LRVVAAVALSLIALIPQGHAMARMLPRVHKPGAVVTRLRPTTRSVALTIDEDFEALPATLGVLSANRARATFFVTPAGAAKNVAALRAIERQGSEVGVLSPAGDTFSRLKPEEAVAWLRASRSSLERLTGGDTANFVRPSGKLPPTLPNAAQAAGQVVALWSRDLADAPPASLGALSKDGDILRLRDGRGAPGRLQAALTSLAQAHFSVDSLTDAVLQSPSHFFSCGPAKAPALPGDHALSRLFEGRKDFWGEVGRTLYGTKEGVRLDGEPAGRLLPSEVRRLVAGYARRMDRPPTPADIMPDGKIVDGHRGLIVNQRRTAVLLLKAPAGADVRPVRDVTPPRWSRGDLARLTLELGRYMTWTHGSTGRLKNIDHAAAILDWYVLLPGEKFSFLDAIGADESEDDSGGWHLAPAYVYGTSLPAYGGGICQVSSTVYQAAKRSGMTILERHRHGRPVPYIPWGWDATVAYPHFDLRFENPRSTPVALRVQVKGARLIASLVGDPKDGPAQGPPARS